MHKIYMYMFYDLIKNAHAHVQACVEAIFTMCIQANIVKGCFLTFWVTNTHSHARLTQLYTHTTADQLLIVRVNLAKRRRYICAKTKHVSKHSSPYKEYFSSARSVVGL